LCCRFKALSNITTLVSVDNETAQTRSFRSRADVMFLPHHCCNNDRAREVCKQRLQPTDPPLVIILNKVFERLNEKLSWIRSFGGQHIAVHANRTSSAPEQPNGVALVITHVPEAPMVEARTGVRTRFLPYASAVEFGRFSARSAYNLDLGFSGGHGKLARRYPWREVLLADSAAPKTDSKRANGTKRLDGTAAALVPSAKEALAQAGVKLRVYGWLPTDAYIRQLAATKIWFATTELGTDRTVSMRVAPRARLLGTHVGTRFYEIMMSGRAMLICDRAPTAYAAIGLQEGVHAAMFNSSEEFEATVLYYLRHEDERLRIVANAQRFVRERHLWHHRATLLVEMIHEALGYSANGS
jgi:hypothetical protein